MRNIFFFPVKEENIFRDLCRLFFRGKRFLENARKNETVNGVIWCILFATCINVMNLSLGSFKILVSKFRCKHFELEDVCMCPLF